MNDENKPKSITEKENEILKFWNENKVFEATLKENNKNESYNFYDGPPFATGLPHYGSLLQSYIKDSIPRYQTMKGKYVRRVWGWDTHGLPIENLIEKELGLKSKKEIEEYGVDKFTRASTDSVLMYEAEWKKIVPRLGRWADMDNPYITMSNTYTESCWWAFSELYKKGLMYEGYKVMHICPRCETPLASSEVAQGYQDVKDISVYTKFELADEPGTYLLAWTTTPWTLPGNTAIAVNKEITYAKVEAESVKYVLAKDLVNKVLGEEVKELETFAGDTLVGKKYKPIFDYYNNPEELAKIKNSENIYKVWHADFVTADAGTGIAHEAPAFGEDDYKLAMENNIPTIIHVGMDGRFYDVVTDFKGERVKWKGETQATDKKICEFLGAQNKILKTEVITHSYPLCWRCETPLLNYATTSWFVAVSTMRDRLVEVNKGIYWIPENVRDGRMGQWLEGARDWAMSRNRYWGAPLPVWKSSATGELFIPSSLRELQEKTKAKNKYIFVRHGQTDANLKFVDSANDVGSGTINVVLGTDLPLNETGINQAKNAGEELKETKIDYVISSPYKRTVETAKYITEGINYEGEILIDDRLKEWQVGSSNEGKTWAQFYKENVGVNYLYEKMAGADESKIDVQNRVTNLIKELEEKYTGKTFVLVTHKSPIACIVSRNNGELFEAGTKNLPVWYNAKNCEILNLDYKPLPTDETGEVNFHLPHIDNLKVYDKDGNLMKREGGVFDCWFESGSMPYAQFHYPFENQELFQKNFPAEFIAEGQDQTRGWFYTMLVLGGGLFDKSPYNSVICTGVINAADGKKMSKSLKNYTDPMELVAKYGSDALRYYLLSSPIVKGESIRFSDDGVKQVYSKNIGRLLNVLSFYEMYKDDTLAAESTSTNVLDKYITSRLTQVKNEVTKGFETLCVDQAFRPIESFVDDLSVWYLRRSRDRFKSDDEQVKKEVVQTTKYVLQNFAKILAPIMPFTSEMIWSKVRDGYEPASVHQTSWGVVSPVSEEDVMNVEKMEMVRSFVSKILDERVKAGIKVRQPLASATFKNVNAFAEGDHAYLNEIMDETNVREVKYNEKQEQEVVLNTTITEELKAEGTYRELVRMIQDKRKENNLKVGEMVRISLLATLDDFTKKVIEDKKAELSKECNLLEISYGEEFKIF